MSGSITGFAYLSAAVCFIMALRGLSSPETARRGNAFGIAGIYTGCVWGQAWTLPGVALVAADHRARWGWLHR